MRPYYPERRFGPTQLRLFPLEPLLEAVNMTPGSYAKRYGIGGRELRTYKEKGLTLLLADRYASREGLHPGDVWEEWWAA